MSKILFTIIAVCLVQLACGRVARESATSTTEIPLFEYSVNFVKTLIDGVHNATLNLAGVKNDDEFWAKGKAQFTTFENTLRSGVSDLDTETKEIQGKAGDLYKSFTAKITEVANELKAKNPELFSGDVGKMQTAAERALRTVAEETKKLQTRLTAEGQEISPKIQDSLKKLQEAVVQTAQKVKTDAEATINSITKKN